VVVRDRKRRGEVAPAEFYCSLEEGVPERVALAVCGIPQRREFPREQAVWCLLRRYLKYAEHLRKPVFLLRRYSIHPEHHMGVLLCGKSREDTLPILFISLKLYSRLLLTYLKQKILDNIGGKKFVSLVHRFCFKTII
jgi:hypothetical protein